MQHRQCKVIEAVLAALLIGATAAACTSLGSSGPSPSPSPTARPVQLKVGQTLKSRGTSVTVRQVRRPMVPPSSSFEPAQKTNEWIGVNVKTCVDANAAALEVGWYTFAGIGPSGDRYPGFAAGSDNPFRTNDWPLPQYPSFGKIEPGSCQAGWLLIVVAKDSPVDRIVYNSPDSTVTGSWKI